VPSSPTTRNDRRRGREKNQGISRRVGLVVAAVLLLLLLLLPLLLQVVVQVAAAARGMGYPVLVLPDLDLGPGLDMVLPTPPPPPDRTEAISNGIALAFIPGTPSTTMKTAVDLVIVAVAPLVAATATATAIATTTVVSHMSTRALVWPSQGDRCHDRCRTWTSMVSMTLDSAGIPPWMGLANSERKGTIITIKNPLVLAATPATKG
jgi:hypothetical protein